VILRRRDGGLISINARGPPEAEYDAPDWRCVMDNGSIAYIVLVIVAFSAFAITLFASSWKTRDWI
jgi:hypothetical protein